MVRVLAGVILAFGLYQFARGYATADCMQMQTNIRQGGLHSLVFVLMAGTVMALLGAPAAIVAVFSGVCLGPMAGAPMSSLALTLGAGLWWMVGHWLLPHGLRPLSMDQYIEDRSWYQDLMRQKAKTAFHWTVRNGFIAPIPFAVLGLVVGSKIRHMNFRSFMTGVFMSSFVLLLGYCLAGASIGCAVINHAQGYDFSQYKTLMILSCVILALLSKAQTIIQERANGI
jgi:uncharacterized membrane protein YdjX (TVP38/TMEM64 family)